MLRIFSDRMKIATRQNDWPAPDRMTPRHERTPAERRSEERNALRRQRLFAMAGHM